MPVTAETVATVVFSVPLLLGAFFHFRFDIVAELLGGTRDIHLPPMILFRRIANLTAKVQLQQTFNGKHSTITLHNITVSSSLLYRKLAQMFGIVSVERCRCSPFGRTLRADLQQKIKQCAVTRSAVILTFPHKKKIRCRYPNVEPSNCVQTLPSLHKKLSRPVSHDRVVSFIVYPRTFEWACTTTGTMEPQTRPWFATFLWNPILHQTGWTFFPMFCIFIYVSIVWVLRQTLRPSGNIYTETWLEYISQVSFSQLAVRSSVRRDQGECRQHRFSPSR